MMITRNTGNCFVILPSYARVAKVVPIRTGSTGITNFVTMLSTTFWNSSKIPVISSLLFHAAARPTMIEKKRALITGIIAGIESWNTSCGNSLRPSTSGVILICGSIIKPEAVAKNAAPIEET